MSAIEADSSSVEAAVVATHGSRRRSPPRVAVPVCPLAVSARPVSSFEVSPSVFATWLMRVAHRVDRFAERLDRAIELVGALPRRVRRRYWCGSTPRWHCRARRCAARRAPSRATFAPEKRCRLLEDAEEVRQDALVDHRPAAHVEAEADLERGARFARRRPRPRRTDS